MSRKAQCLACSLAAFLALLFSACSQSSSPEPVAAVETVPAPPEVVAMGEELYGLHCAQCHYDGSGDDLRPKLLNVPGVTSEPARTARAVLKGMLPPPGTPPGVGMMPAMDWLEDEEIAAVVTYVRTTFGNRPEQVSASDVARWREQD